MDVKIGSRWKPVIEDAIESGRYRSEEEVVNEGLRMVAMREQRHRELQALIDEAYAEDGTVSIEDARAAVEVALDEDETTAEGAS